MDTVPQEGVSGAPQTERAFVFTNMQVPEGTHAQYHEVMHSASEKMRGDSNFVVKSLVGLAHAVEAYVIMLIETIVLVPVTVLKFTFTLITFNFSQAFSEFRDGLLGIVHGAKLAVFMPAYIFVGLFKPETIYTGLAITADEKAVQGGGSSAAITDLEARVATVEADRSIVEQDNRALSIRISTLTRQASTSRDAETACSQIRERLTASAQAIRASNFEDASAVEQLIHYLSCRMEPIGIDFSRTGIELGAKMMVQFGSMEPAKSRLDGAAYDDARRTYGEDTAMATYAKASKIYCTTGIAGTFLHPVAGANRYVHVVIGIVRPDEDVQYLMQRLPVGVQDPDTAYNEGPFAFAKFNMDREDGSPFFYMPTDHCTVAASEDGKLSTSASTFFGVSLEDEFFTTLHDGAGTPMESSFNADHAWLEPQIIGALMTEKEARQMFGTYFASLSEYKAENYASSAVNSPGITQDLEAALGNLNGEGRLQAVQTRAHAQHEEAESLHLERVDVVSVGSGRGDRESETRSPTPSEERVREDGDGTGAVDVGVSAWGGAGDEDLLQAHGSVSPVTSEHGNPDGTEFGATVDLPQGDERGGSHNSSVGGGEVYFM